MSDDNEINSNVVADKCFCAFFTFLCKYVKRYKYIS